MSSIQLAARNPRIRRLKRLVARSKARSEERAFVVEGSKLVAEVLRSPMTVEAVYHAPGALNDDIDAQLITGCGAGIVDRFEVDPSVLASALDAVNPQPIAAVVELPDEGGSVMPSDGPILVAVELRDPGNLGTLLRTAEAAGLGGVVVAGDSVDRFSPKVVRASAGSLFRLPIASWADPAEAFVALRAGGRKVVAAVVAPDAQNYDTLDLGNAAIVVGNEPHGLSDHVIDEADAACTIPLAASVESLNVAAAGAVLCFEAARQRRAGEAV